MTKSDEQLLKEANELDAAYTSADITLFIASSTSILNPSDSNTAAEFKSANAKILIASICLFLIIPKDKKKGR